MLRKVPILSIFLSTLSLRRATYQDKFSIPSDNISIHALLAESDGTGFFVLDERHDISIHALLAESDTPTLESLTPTQTFLSTLSLRRATRPVSALYSVNRYFYPRSPCGERRHFSSKQRTLPKFLSTLSLRRATVSQHSPSTVHTKFLSTLSLRRATVIASRVYEGNRISIHALLAESDCWCWECRPPYQISIHALLAESDPWSSLLSSAIILFLSTLSLRRATKPYHEKTTADCFISIHALLAESDLGNAEAVLRMWNFYPRSPCGERRRVDFCFLCCIIISIHALLAESDSIILPPVDTSSVISIHALLAESDRAEIHASNQQEKFLSTLSLRRATIVGMLNGPHSQISIHALLAESDNGGPIV